jgi:hypothetical protein
MQTLADEIDDINDDEIAPPWEMFTVVPQTPAPEASEEIDMPEPPEMGGSGGVDIDADDFVDNDADDAAADAEDAADTEDDAEDDAKDDPVDVEDGAADFTPLAAPAPMPTAAPAGAPAPESAAPAASAKPWEMFSAPSPSKDAAPSVAAFSQVTPEVPAPKAAAAPTYTVDDFQGPEDISDKAGFGYRFGKLDKVNGLVLHHTGDRHDKEGINSYDTHKQGIDDAYASGYGAQYRLARNGNLVRIAPEGAVMQHMRNGSGQFGQGRGNRNMEGIEIVAKNDDDITPAQQRTLDRFVDWHAKKYGYDRANGIFGHSEVNPGHRTDEGERNARIYRGGQPSEQPTQVAEAVPVSERGITFGRVGVGGPKPWEMYTAPEAAPAAPAPTGKPWEVFAPPAPPALAEPAQRAMEMANFGKPKQAEPMPVSPETAAWAEGEKAQAGRMGTLWSGVQSILEQRKKGIAENTVGQKDPFPAVTEWLDRKMVENIDEAKKQDAQADAIKQGLMPGPQEVGTSGWLKQFYRQAGRGIVEDTVGNTVKAAGEIDHRYWKGKPLSEVEQHALYRFGKETEEWAKATWPDDPARQYEFSSKLARGFGSMVGFMGPAVGLQVIKYGMTKMGAAGFANFIGSWGVDATISAGATGALSTAGSMTDDALKAFKEGKTVDGRPMTEADLDSTYKQGLLWGSTEALPIAHFFARKGGGGWVRPVLLQMGEEGGQEGVQTIGENKTARDHYDDKRHWDEGAWENMLVGSILGFGMEGGKQAATRLAGLRTGNQPAPAPTPPAAPGATPGAPQPAAGPSPATPPVGVTPPDEPAAPVADTPTAEPFEDLLAQAKDLADPANPRKALWIPAANLPEDGTEEGGLSDEQAHEIRRALGKGWVAEYDFDRQGGQLIAESQEVLDLAKQARDSGVPMQEILGALTGAGTGKLPDANKVVQQVTPEGAVTRESIVPEAQVPETVSAMEMPGREVRVVEPQQALLRREGVEIPSGAQTAEDVAVAGARAEPNPTEAQLDAGNYRKGHVDVQGLDISIETPKGGIRRGPGWRVRSPAAYGYFKGVPARAKDKEHVDVYIGDSPTSDRAFVVDQHDIKTGRYDEPKTIIGVRSLDEAISIYDAGFSDGKGPDRRRAVTEVSIDELKEWLQTGDATKPFASQRVSRNEPPAGVPGVAERGGSLSQSERAPLPRVRGEGDQAAPGMGAELFGVSGGGGATTASGPNAGQDQQQRELRAGQRPLGDSETAGAQYAQEPTSNVYGQDSDIDRMGGGDRFGAVGSTISPEAGRDVGRGGADNAESGRSPEGFSKPLTDEEIDTLADGHEFVRWVSGEANPAVEDAAIAVEIRKDFARYGLTPEAFETEDDLRSHLAGEEDLAAPEGTEDAQPADAEDAQDAGDEADAGAQAVAPVVGPGTEGTEDAVTEQAGAGPVTGRARGDVESADAGVAGDRDGRAGERGNRNVNTLVDPSPALVDALVDAWRYLREFNARPKPQTLTGYLIAAGGLRDDAREVRHIAGAAKERPGLVNKGGINLDDAALAAWEAGFFPEHTERPDIAEFLDKLQEDLHSNNVFSGADEAYTEDAKYVADMREDLANHGITHPGDFRSENALRRWLGQEPAKENRQRDQGQPAPTAEGARPEGSEGQEGEGAGRAEGVRDSEDAHVEGAVDAAAAPDTSDDRGPAGAGADGRGAEVASPPPAPGKVRMYHGGEPQVDHDGPLWFSSDRKYAEGYATRDGRKARVWYVDIPEDHPLITPEYPEQGIKRGFTFNVELPGEIAKNRQVLDAPAPKKSRLGKGLADIKPTGGAEAVDRVAGDPIVALGDEVGVPVDLSDWDKKTGTEKENTRDALYKALAKAVVGLDAKALQALSPRAKKTIGDKLVPYFTAKQRSVIAKALGIEGYDFTALKEGMQPTGDRVAGQTSFLPGATTKEQIAAAAKAKEQKGGNEPADIGLFSSDRDQMDLVDMAKTAPVKEKTGTEIGESGTKTGEADIGALFDAAVQEEFEGVSGPGLRRQAANMLKAAERPGRMKQERETLKSLEKDLAALKAMPSSSRNSMSNDRGAIHRTEAAIRTQRHRVEKMERLLAAKKSAASAAKNIGMGLEQVASGLTTLFGGKKLSSGVSFDEETYAQAVPFFKAGIAHFQQAGSDVAAAVRELVRYLAGAGMSRDAIVGMKPYVIRFMKDVEAGKVDLDQTGESDAPGSREGVERDRGAGQPEDAVGEAGVPDVAGADGKGAREEGAGEKSAGPVGGVPAGDAAAVGAGRDRVVPAGSPRSDGGAAGGAGRRRGGDAGLEGVSAGPVPAKTVAKTSTADASVVVALQLQAIADASGVAFKLNDADNIHATLPALKPAQRDDVVKAEARFSQPNGHGFMFTNGTGTGKSWTGLGVIKRFLKQGKGNILILAPSQGIIEDSWVKTGAMLGVNVSRLPDTKSAGEGVVATTYANLRENDSLVKRAWDLIVADESQHFSQEKSGSPSAALQAMRAISNHSPNSRARMTLKPQADELDSLKEGSQAHKDALASYNKNLESLTESYKNEDRTKVLFLSATPFAYRKSTDYAEGFLFDYPPRTGKYNDAGGQQEFLKRNFGYQVRYNRAEEPGPEVNVGVLEREFYERLKREGVLSGRRLEVEADYDRRFVLVDDAVGAKIDQAMDWLSTEKNGRYTELADMFGEQFNHLSQRRLLEAIKAKHAIPRIKRDLELGRKVVVFHDYLEGGGLNPFLPPRSPNQRVRPKYGEDPASAPTLGQLYSEFLRANPYVKGLDFSEFTNPIAALTEAFPKATLYNGSVPNKKRAQARDSFNKDGSDNNLIIIQSAAGEAGISLHDTSGKHQRILYNLGLPTRPTMAIQQEGRIYREGQVSNAILRYMSTGTGWERRAFAQTIAERASTAENLALGEEARALRDAFIDAFNAAEDIEQGPDEGKGGKESDRAKAGALTAYERAKAFYFAEGKTKGRRDQREGTDYFATPEPVGLKMVEWADVQSGERVLEPSAGHGAIARWFPEGANRTLIEPSSSLASRAGLSSPGAKLVNERFEDHYIGNKYDAIVMNPPFGVGGKDAFAHLQKAVGHLRDGGRVVAILPRGPAADKRLSEFTNSKANQNIFAVMDISMPPVMFERAGTQAATRLVVFERHDKGTESRDLLMRDLSDAETINELFDRIEDIGLSSRLRPGGEKPTSTTVSPDVELAAPPYQKFSDPTPPSAAISFKSGETKHGKTGEDVFVASIAKPVPRATYEQIAKVAKQHKGYYSSFKGSGAIPGFQFATKADRDAFLAEYPTPSQIKASLVDNRPMTERLRELREAKKAGTAPKVDMGPAVGSFEQQAEHGFPQWRLFGKILDRGNQASVQPMVVAESLDAAHGLRFLVPDGANVYTLQSVKPDKLGVFSEKPNDVVATFVSREGKTHTIIVDWNQLRKAGAFQLDGNVFFNRLTRASDPEQLIDQTRAQLTHELVHLYWHTGRLGRLAFDRLVAHGKKLQILEGDSEEYLRMMANPDANKTVKRTVREAYEEYYATHPDPQGVLEEEYATHVVDFYVRGKLSEKDAAPVVDIIDDILTGKVARRPATKPVAAGQPAAAIGAWHGSPHDFDRFDVGRIGTGEGAQAFGRGLYFAEREGVAKSYRDALAQDGGLVGGKRYNDLDPKHLAARTIYEEGGVDNARKLFDQRIKELRSDPDQGFVQRMVRARTALQSDLPAYAPSAGRLYEVKLNVEPEELLDWDKKLADQPESVRDAIKGLWPTFYKGHDATMLSRLLRWHTGREAFAKLHGTISHANSAEAAEALRSVGIKGIRYLDRSSRGKGEGTSNFVIFSDKDVEIVSKDGKPVSNEERSAVIAGAQEQATQASSIPTPKIDSAAQAELSTRMSEAVNIVNRIAGKDVKVVFRPTIGVGRELRGSADAMAQSLGQEPSKTVGGFYRPASQPDVGLDRHLAAMRRGVTEVRADALIGLATNDPDYSLKTTAGHEAWHHVEEALATPAELKLLNSPTEMRRMLRDMVAPEVGLQPEDPRLAAIPAHEARAIAFGRYRREKEDVGMQPAGVHIGVRRFFDRVLSVFKAVSIALLGKTYKDIFESARTGEMAERGELEANRQKVAEAYSQEIGGEAFASSVPRRPPMAAAILAMPPGGVPNVPAYTGGPKPGIQYNSRLGSPLKSFAKTLERWWAPLENLPKLREYRIGRGRAKGRKDEAEQTARGFYEIYKKATEADKKAAYAYLTDPNGNPATIADAKIRQTSIDVKDLFNRIGDQIVSMGIISQASRDEYKDGYLPRLYLKHVLGDLEANRLGVGESARPSKMGYALQRNKNLDRETRIILGEILDPGFLVAAGTSRVMRDIAMIEFLDQIAGEDEWVFRNNLVPWKGRWATPYYLRSEGQALIDRALFADQTPPSPGVLSNAEKMRIEGEHMLRAAAVGIKASQNVPKGYRQIPDSKRYGMLRGMWVRKEIVDDLLPSWNVLPEDAGTLDKMFWQGGMVSKFNRYWKAAHVPLNPSTQLRNLASNSMWINLSGMSPRAVVKYMKKAMEDMRAGGPMSTFAETMGLRASGFSETELINITKEFLDYDKKVWEGHPAAPVMLPLIMAKNLIDKGLGKAGDIYQLSEAWLKIAKMMHEVDVNGMTREDGFLEAQKWLFDYSEIPRSIRWLRNAPIGAPFITYQYKALPRVLELLATKPWRMAPYVAMPFIMMKLFGLLHGVDDDDVEKLKQALPEYMRKKTNAFVLPTDFTAIWRGPTAAAKDEFGRWRFFDFGYLIPWSAWYEAGTEMAGGHPYKALKELGITGGPIGDAYTAVRTNLDPFTLRPIADPRDPPERRMADILNYAWRVTGPPWMTDAGFLNKMIDAYKEKPSTKRGDPPLTMTQAALRGIGLNVYPVEPEKTRANNLHWMDDEIKKTRARMTGEMKNQKYSEEYRAKLRKQFQDHIADLLKKRQQYARDSEIHPKLQSGN